ncbi:MAG: hypothetical protein Q4B69_03415, partial [Slackia sp.]|nr:hypothetical protein [Slackia sp.]
MSGHACAYDEKRNASEEKRVLTDGFSDGDESCAAPGSHCGRHEKDFVVFVMHASVGSGHRSAALAVAQALESMRENGDSRVPANAEVEVLDILDFARVSIDGDK